MRVRAADKGSRKALTGPQKGGIAVEKEYYTYGSDETRDAEGIQATSSDQIADETTTSTDTTSAVSYRLERIAEEALQKILSALLHRMQQVRQRSKNIRPFLRPRDLMTTGLRLSAHSLCRKGRIYARWQLLFVKPA